MSKASVAQRMMDLFSGYTAAHGTHGDPVREDRPSGSKWSIHSSARTWREPVTLDLWEKHLAGHRPLGIMPYREDGTCLWASIDVDDYELNPLDLIKAVERHALPLLPVRSKSGGMHLFLFLAAPQSVRTVQPALKDVAARLGLAGCEIFPKEVEVLWDKGALPTWMTMPYSGTSFGGKLSDQVALRLTGAELTVEEFLSAAEAAKVTSDGLAALVWSGQRRGPVGGRAVAGGPPAPAVPFSDGPPCLQHLASQGVVAGQQNNTLFMMAMYFKRANPDNWKDKLEAANRDFLTPPGSSEALVDIIRRMERKDYDGYTCKTQPMAAHCNSAVCRTRRHGVGADGDYPSLAGIQRTDVEPPTWYVTVGEVQVECQTEDLQLYMRFHKLCMERLSQCFRAMKQDAWLTAVGEVMQHVIMLPTPPEVGLRGQFEEVLGEFLTNRHRGQKVDDLFSGRPFEDVDEKRHYFRMKDLMGQLERSGNLRTLTRGWVTQRVRDLGGGNHFFNVKDRALRCWWVPSSCVQAPPSVDLPARKTGVM